MSEHMLGIESKQSSEQRSEHGSELLQKKMPGAAEQLRAPHTWRLLSRRYRLPGAPAYRSSSRVDESSKREVRCRELAFPQRCRQHGGQHVSYRNATRYLHMVGDLIGGGGQCRVGSPDELCYSSFTQPASRDVCSTFAIPYLLYHTCRPSIAISLV